jgi:hypothetical protein
LRAQLLKSSICSYPKGEEEWRSRNLIEASRI